MPHIKMSHVILLIIAAIVALQVYHMVAKHPGQAIL